MRIALLAGRFVLHVARAAGSLVGAVRLLVAVCPPVLFVLAVVAWLCVLFTRNGYEALLTTATALSVAMLFALTIKFGAYLIVARRKVVLGDLSGDSVQLRATTDALIREALRTTRLLREGRRSSRHFSTDDDIKKAAGYAAIVAEEQFDPAVYAAGRDAVLEVWKVKIPAGLLFALANGLARGPRLHLTLSQGMGRMDLEARLARHERPQAWYLSEPAGDDPIGAARRLGAVLAERLVAHIALGRAHPSPSGEHLLRGLAAFEVAATLPHDAIGQLKMAEGCLLAAIESAPSAVAYHNLGVVYTELEERLLALSARSDDAESGIITVTRAAETALLRSIEEDPMRASSLYALAMSYWVRLKADREVASSQPSGAEAKRYRDEILFLLDRAAKIGGSSDRAQANGLRALVEWEDSRLPEARKHALASAVYSWRARCRQEFHYRASRRGSGRLEAVEAARTDAGIGLQNLAGVLYQSALGEEGGRRRLRLGRAARSAAALAGKTQPRSPAPPYLRGSIEANVLDRPLPALTAYREAVALDPGDIDMWAGMAWGAARAGDGEALDAAMREVLDRPSLSMDAVDRLATALAEAGHPDARKVSELASVLAFLDGDVDLAEIEGAFEIYTREGRTLKAAHAAMAAGRMLLAANPKRAETLFKKALGSLTSDRPGEVQVQGLRALLARAYRLQDDLVRALAEAQRAVEVDPLNAFERQELAEVHWARGAIQEACVELQRARAMQPGNPALNRRLGIAHFVLARQATSAADYVSNLNDAAAALESARQVEDAQGAYTSAESHLWLGRIRARLGEFHAAGTHFVLARAKPEFEGIAWWREAETALAAHQYVAAEKAFSRATDWTSQGLGTPAGRHALVGPADDRHSMAELAIWIATGWSVSETARGGELGSAWQRVEDVAVLLPDVRADGRPTFEAMLDEARGRMLHATAFHEQAAEYLRASVRRVPDAEAFMYLASTLASLAGQSGGASARRLAEEAQHALAVSDALDVGNDHAEDRARIHKRLRSRVGARLDGPPREPRSGPAG